VLKSYELPSAALMSAVVCAVAKFFNGVCVVENNG
jgi:hypothetical protein